MVFFWLGCGCAFFGVSGFFLGFFELIGVLGCLGLFLVVFVCLLGCGFGVFCVGCCFLCGLFLF